MTSFSHFHAWELVSMPPRGKQRQKRYVPEWPTWPVLFWLSCTQ